MTVTLEPIFKLYEPVFQKFAKDLGADVTVKQGHKSMSVGSPGRGDWAHVDMAKDGKAFGYVISNDPAHEEPDPMARLEAELASAKGVFEYNMGRVAAGLS